MEGGDLRVSIVEERVVSIKFDNAAFERGVKTTLDSLATLNKGLQMQGATKGLEDLNSTANKFSLKNIEDGVSGIASKFTAMSVVAITALSKITSAAIDSGTQLVKSLTIDPIKSGLDEYETNLNSIQTILSNTQWQHTGLADVNDALQQLNHYADLTIYNFSEMARNIGTFTAAGVKLQVSVDAIKGIANLAAISGSSSLQASTAMYQLSQALATGTVKLMDWNSVVNAGMGGKVFQDALKETARVHGVAVDKIIKEEGSFRDSLHKGWLTSSILTETLQKFTGDLTASQLKAMGYNDKQIAGILKMGKTAQDAATKVKTFSQLINTLQEAAGSGWAQTWQLIFGDFEEAKTLFSGVYNVLGGFITASSNARNKVLADWKELGGRKSIIQSISNVFNALISVLVPVRDAFRQIFPPLTGKKLMELTIALQRFTENLRLTISASDKIKRTFAGVFAVFHIVWTIVTELVKTLFHLVGAVSDNSGGFLSLTAKVGDFLVKLDKAITSGTGLTKFFDKLRTVLAAPLQLLGWISDKIGELFGGAKKAAEGVGELGDAVGNRLTTRLATLKGIGDKIHDLFEKLTGMFHKTGGASDGLGKKISDLIDKIGPKIVEAISHIKFNNVLDALNTGLFAVIALAIQRFLKNGLSITGILNIGGSGGLLTSITKTFGELTNTLKAMQAQLKANALIKIAAAIAILTASMVALSLINSDKLTGALVAISVMFTELSAAGVVLDKFASSAGLLKMPFITASLILLAVAIDVLSIAVVKLAKLDWDSLLRGLTGLTVVMGALLAMVKLMPDDKQLIATGAGLVVLAGAIALLVKSVTDLAALSWEDLAKGLLGTAALLGALLLFTKFSEVDKGGLLQGAGIALLALGIGMIADAVVKLSNLSWTEIAKGLLGLAGALAIVVGSLELLPPAAILGGAGMLVVGLTLSTTADTLKQLGDMSWSEILRGLTAMLGTLAIMTAALYVVPPTAPLAAAGLYVAALAMVKVGDVMSAFGAMDWGAIGKAMVALAGSLTVISVALIAMTGSLGGAAALLVVAGALAVIVPIFKALGAMSWGNILTGIGALALLFTVLGVASAVIAPVIPALLGLAGAVALLGIGLLAAGAGVLAFSVGLTALALIGEKGADAIVKMVTKMAELIPMLMVKLAEGMIAFGNVISTAGETIFKVLVTVITSFLTAIDTLAPKIIDTLFKLLMKLLDTLVSYVPKMTDAGLKILIGFLEGVAKNIGRVVTAATDVMVAFLNTIGKQNARLVDAGFQAIIDFINGVTKAVDKNSEKMGKAGGDLAVAIIKGMAKGILAGIGEVTSAAKKAAKAALDAAKDFLGIHSPSKKFEEEVGKTSMQGLARGFDRYSTLVTDAATAVGTDAMHSLQNTLASISEAVKSDMDMMPTIRPVLDLSNIKAGSGQIDSMLRTRPFTVDGTYSQAQAVSADVADRLVRQAELDDARLRPDIKFEQNNYSPKALSEAEIYRQTNNQLSKIKEAVAP